jgi:purine-binding chemotaxis protein CheW
MSEVRPGDTRAAPQSWDALARSAARRAPVADPDAERQLLAFAIDRDRYALPVERVREIARLRPITPVPRVPRDLRGVISLRGEIVQVIDLRARLGLVATEPRRSARIVVVYAGDSGVAGLLVDAVTEVLRVPEESIRAVAGEADAVEALCVRGESFVSLLDLDRVLELDAGL